MPRGIKSKPVSLCFHKQQCRSHLVHPSSRKQLPNSPKLRRINSYRGCCHWLLVGSDHSDLTSLLEEKAEHLLFLVRRASSGRLTQGPIPLVCVELQLGPSPAWEGGARGHAGEPRIRTRNAIKKQLLSHLHHPHYLSKAPCDFSRQRWSQTASDNPDSPPGCRETPRLSDKRMPCPLRLPPSQQRSA